MILINKQTYNTVVLTLTEKSIYMGYDTSGNLTGDTYNLFVFTNNSSGQQKIFTAEDVSQYKKRYNQFTIVEKYTNTDPLEGVIHLTGDSSQWSYEIYESNVPFSADTLAVSATTGEVLESGRVFVKGDEGNPSINDVYL